VFNRFVLPRPHQVICQPKGSMTLNAFPTWCKHFVEPLERGPDGKTRQGAKYHILFLDGHSSRWSVEGLDILKANNVIAICIPSHTSVWGQVISNIAGLLREGRALTHSLTHSLTQATRNPALGDN